MKKIKNMNIYSMLKHKFKLVTGVGILTTSIMLTGCGASVEEKEDAIIEYYGIDSDENKVLKYLEIAQKLNELNLDEYKVNDEMFNKYEISSELKTIDEIEKLIKEFDTVEFSVEFDERNFEQLNDSIVVVLNLIMQEKLVNQYIYDIGYGVAHDNILYSVKDYTEEVFGLEDKYFELNYYENRFEIELGDSEEYRIYDIESGKLNAISNNLSLAVQTDISYDDNDADNYEYSEDRINLIRNTLYSSVELNTEIEKEDLYDKKLVKKCLK